MREHLRVDPSEHPMLSAEPVSNPHESRKRLAEFMFETLKTPALFMAKDPVLAAFSHGKGTAVVVDIGSGKTAVSPVSDGFVLHQGKAQRGEGETTSAKKWEVGEGDKKVSRYRREKERSK